MSRMTLMTGPERRRRWAHHERQQILLAAFAPGAVVADVSRQHDVSTSLIYKWKREALAEGTHPVSTAVIEIRAACEPNFRRGVGLPRIDPWWGLRSD